ncbi:MAG: hypothetical protein D6694_04330, partial [Gammaproteobacteria bacterium]
PQVGDSFEGIVFDEDRGEVLLKIPGLDADDAYGVIRRDENILLGKVKEGDKVVCVVTDVKQEHDYWRVECQLG